MYARRVVLDGGNTRALCGGCCATPEFICACILRYNSRLPVTRQLGLFSMLGLWALLTLIGVFFAVWKGYGGHEFAATLTSFAFLFLVMLLFAARGAETILATRLGAGAAYLLGAALFLVYLIYALGTNTFTLGRAATAAVLVFVPLAVAASAERKPAGTWQDFAIIVGIWVAVKPFPNHWGFSMSHWLGKGFTDRKSTRLNSSHVSIS